jgi:hypothetical protein
MKLLNVDYDIVLLSSVFIKNDFKLIDEIIKQDKISSSIDIEDLFSLSCEFGHTQLVEKLINDGLNPSFENNISLSYAFKNGHFDVSFLLINNKNINIKKVCDECLVNSAKNGHLELVNLILPYIHKKNNRAMRFAAKNGHFDIVEKLYNNKLTNSKSAIIYSNKYKQEDITDFLFSKEKVRKNLQIKHSALFHQLSKKYLFEKIINF